MRCRRRRIKRHGHVNWKLHGIRFRETCECDLGEMSGLPLGDYMFTEHQNANYMLEPIADPVADTKLEMS